MLIYNRKMKTFYVTTPIYYVNDKPHIGSFYSTMFADILAKFYKLNDYDVKFLTGTDEHGQKIQQSSEKAGKNPKDFVDEVSVEFRKLIEIMDLHPTNFETINDNFIRTTMPPHIEFVQKVWKVLVKNDWIYKGKYEGWYCVSDEAFYTESDLVKQEDGSLKTSLGKNVEWKEEESYFFRLSEFQEMLLKIYKDFPDLIKPYNKKTEVISFVSGLTMKDYDTGKEFIKGHLVDLSISRNTFDWGIRISCDLEGKELLDKNGEWNNNLKKGEKHVIYVWLDALFNYLTALGCDEHNDYKKYWFNGEKKIHLVGKDILRFHTVYWPAFLIAFNYSKSEFQKIKEPINDFKKYLPSTVFAHGFLTNDGRKISKSFGNAIYPVDEVEWLKTNFDLNNETARDYFKYYLITNTPFGNDGDYSRSRLIEKINSDLVNKIGNLAKRTLDMIYKNCDAKVPNISKFDNIASLDFSAFEKYINNLDFQLYIDNIIKVVDIINKYMEDKEPWKLAKTNVEEMKKVLYSVANILTKIAILLQPIIPFLSKKILEGLGFNEDFLSFKILNNDLKNGQKILEPTIIAPRIRVKN
jgi:methionyl-tRNA synthetase